MDTQQPTMMSRISRSVPRIPALAMRPTDLNGIIQTYTESMGAADNSAVKEAQKKVIAQMLLKMSRLK